MGRHVAGRFYVERAHCGTKAVRTDTGTVYRVKGWTVDAYEPAALLDAGVCDQSDSLIADQERLAVP